MTLSRGPIADLRPSPTEQAEHTGGQRVTLANLKRKSGTANSFRLGRTGVSLPQLGGDGRGHRLEMVKHSRFPPRLGADGDHHRICAKPAFCIRPDATLITKPVENGPYGLLVHPEPTRHFGRLGAGISTQVQPHQRGSRLPLAFARQCLPLLFRGHGVHGSCAGSSPGHEPSLDQIVEHGAQRLWIVVAEFIEQSAARGVPLLLEAIEH